MPGALIVGFGVAPRTREPCWLEAGRQIRRSFISLCRRRWVEALVDLPGRGVEGGLVVVRESHGFLDVEDGGELVDRLLGQWWPDRAERLGGGPISSVMTRDASEGVRASPGDGAGWGIGRRSARSSARASRLRRVIVAAWRRSQTLPSCRLRSPTLRTRGGLLCRPRRDLAGRPLCVGLRLH
jgi:hypothetical protein